MEKILYSLRSLHAFLGKEKSSAIYLATSRTLVNKLAWAIKEIGVAKTNIILVPDGEKAKEWKEL